MSIRFVIKLEVYLALTLTILCFIGNFYSNDLEYLLLAGWGDTLVYATYLHEKIIKLEEAHK